MELDANAKGLYSDTSGQPSINPSLQVTRRQPRLAIIRSFYTFQGLHQQGYSLNLIAKHFDL